MPFALIPHAVLNTIFIVLGFVLSSAFALYIRRSNRKHEVALLKAKQDYETELREAAEKHAKEQREVEQRIETMQQHTERIEILERGQVALGAAVVPINAVFQAVLVKSLTKFDQPDMDKLMEKLGDVEKQIPPTITEEEEEALALACQERAESITPGISPELDDERDAALILPIQMRRVKREAARLADGTEFAEIKVVGALHTGEGDDPTTEEIEK